MKNILISGGLGFIGSHLCEELIKKNNVFVVDNLSKRVHPFRNLIYKPKGIKFIESSINNVTLLKDLLKNIDFFYHFASHQDHLRDYSKFIDNNIKSTAIIFEILSDLKNKRLRQFILASSQSIYGDGIVIHNGKKISAKRSIINLKKKKWRVKDKKEKFLSHKETDTPNPTNFYGLSKLYQENIVKQCAKDLDINYTILRYSIVQGSRQSFFNSYSGLCRNLISSYLKNERPIIFEDGNSTRDFINILDVTRINSRILNNEKAFNQTFNVGGGKKYSLLNFDKIVRKKLKTKIYPIKDRYFRINDPRYNISDIGKIKRMLNWKPNNEIEISIQDYIKWINKYKKYLKYSKSGLKKMIRQGVVIDCNKSTF